LVTVFAYLPEVTALCFSQRRHRPIIDHQYVNPAQSREQIAEASVGAGQRQIPE
jgi:hypothetical protein